MSELPSVLYTQGHVDAQAAQIDRLRAELAKWERRDAAHCPRAEKAEAAIARVRELCERAAYVDATSPNARRLLAQNLLAALDGAE